MKCIDKVCVDPEKDKEPDIPEEYFAADNDYFYVSEDELPWAQAQYDCLSRKGHLAELDGTLRSKLRLLDVLEKANASGRSVLILKSGFSDNDYQSLINVAGTGLELQIWWILEPFSGFIQVKN